MPRETLSKNRPNFIIFLTDDQGYGDLSCMGATDFRTPNLDRMAASGARFTDWYSNSPVCSPSRASLLTGRYPGNGLVDWPALNHFGHPHAVLSPLEIVKQA